MKIVWALLLMGWLFTGSAYGQSGFGLRGGSSYSQASFTPTARRAGVRSPDQVLVGGFETGLFWRMLNNRYLGLQAELNYSVKGWHIYPGTFAAHFKEYHYVQLPLLTHFQLGRGRLKFVVQAGALLAYAHQIKDVELPDPDAGAPIRYAHQQQLPWQYGIVGGAGPAVELPWGLGMLQLEARFTHFLSNLLEIDITRGDDFASSNQQNITFGLQWVYMFEEKR